MAAIVKELNLNRNPQYVKNNSLVFAKNVKLDALGSNIVMDDNVYYSKLTIECNGKGYTNIKIAGCISTPTEVVMFFSNKDDIKPILNIARYNEEENRTIFIKTNISYNGGEISGTYNYNVRNELIVIFCEDSSTGVKNYLRTINCGTFKDDLTFDEEESFFNLCPDVPLCKCKLLSLVSGVNIPNGVYQFFIRYKIDSTNYSKWFPIGVPYYGIHKEYKNLINYGSAPNSKFEAVVNNVNIDSSYGFELNLNFENKPDYIKKFQLGYILNHDNAMVGRIYNTFDINDDSINNIIFDGRYIFEHEVANFTEHPLNLFNVDNIVNYNNRVYVSNYNENNDNLLNDEITDFVSKITARFALEDVPEIKKESGNHYKINFTFKKDGKSITSSVEYVTSGELDSELSLTINDDVLLAFGLSGKDKVCEVYNSSGGSGSVPICNVEDCYIKLKKDGTFVFVVTEDNKEFRYLDVKTSEGKYKAVYNTFKYTTEFKDYEEISSDNFSLQTLVPNEVYNFFIHFVRKDGTYTNGYQLSNDVIPFYNESDIDVRWTIEEFCTNEPEYYKTFIQDDVRNRFGTKYLYEILNNSYDNYFGYYTNSKGDNLFRAPKVTNKIIKTEFYVPETVPSEFVGYFFSYEKVEPLVLYQGLARKLIRSLDAELNLSGYKPDFVYFVGDTNDAVSVKNSKLWASNIYPKTIGNNGGVEIDLDIESGITLESMKDNICVACIFNRNIYTKSSKTLIKLTDVITDKDVKSTGIVTDVLCDFNYPGFYCREYFIEYTKDLAFVDAGDYEKPSGLREVSSNLISNDSISEDFTQTCGSYYKYSRYDLSCISIKQQPFTKVMLVDKDTLQYNLYVDPANLSDTFELKSDFILNKVDATGLLDIISSSEYDDQRPIIERFDNTVRRSDVFANESIENTWRNFGANNYKVISNIRGKIVKLVPMGKNFIIHLEHSMFMFDRDNKMKLQDREIQLSTPDTFELEAQEVFTSENGFAGLQHKESAIVNGFGYTFYDNYTKYIYNYDNGKFNILSLSIQKFINDNRIEKVCILSDNINSRIIFCFYIPNETVTISYNFITKSFISLHDFEFNNAWNTRDKCYLRTRDNTSLMDFNNNIGQLDKYSHASNINFRNENSDLVEDRNTTFPVLYTNVDEDFSPYSFVDIIFNEAYDTTKALNSITYILNKIGARYTRGVACDNGQEHYPGEKILLYSELSETDYQNLQDKANNYSLTNQNKVNENSYKYPWYEKGKWNYNYFRNILDDTDVVNQGYSDSKSLIYGKYIVVRLVLKSTIKFKLENINFNVNRYSNETVN